MTFLYAATSISDDCELFMIQQLREICGHDFVSKLRRMFADKGLSKVSLCVQSLNHNANCSISIMTFTIGFKVFMVPMRCQCPCTRW